MISLGIRIDQRGGGRPHEPRCDWGPALGPPTAYHEVGWHGSKFLSAKFLSAIFIAVTLLLLLVACRPTSHRDPGVPSAITVCGCWDDGRCTTADGAPCPIPTPEGR